MSSPDKTAERYPVPEATVAAPHQTELIIKKSLFVAQTCHCPTAAAARDFIACIRGARPDASHNCWAFTALPPGRVGLAASSDDGEPHGTAGRPMLQCLLGSGVGEICMVVSRWFGGIKLGAGGLVKAYQQAAQENLHSLPTFEKVPWAHWRLVLDYGDLEMVKRYLQEAGARIDSGEYGAAVVLKGGMPKDRLGGFAENLAALTSGRVAPEFLPKEIFRERKESGAF